MSVTERTAGVIGGLGPQATVDFMARVLALTPVQTEQDHIRMLVDQNPKVVSRQQALLRGGANPGPELSRMAARLEAAGCDFLVMPCNTAHAFQAEIEAAVRIPFISIVEATVAALPADATSAGLLTTPAGAAAGTYPQALDDRGLELVSMTVGELESLMDLAWAIKAGDRSAAIGRAMRSLAEDLIERGADTLIAGCTEIPLVLDSADVSVPLVSSTDALARRTIELARGERPLP